MRHELPTILFVHPACAGGASVSLAKLMRCLSSSYRCVVLVGAGNSGVEKTLGEVAAQVITGPPLARLDHVASRWLSVQSPYVAFRILQDAMKVPASLRWFESVLNEVRPDIVYCNTLPAVAYGQLAHQRGHRTVLHVRESVAAGYLGLRRLALRELIERNFDHVFFISPIEQSALRVSNPQDVVFNWVNMGDWNPEGRQMHRGPVRILYVGGLNSIKGLDVLLQALVVLRDRGVQFKCSVIGVEPSTGSHPKLRALLHGLGWRTARDRLEAIRTNKLLDSLEVSPFLASPSAEFARADIVVFPALVDHFARPLVEAGAFGLPSVSSDFPGPRLAVLPERTGLLVPPADSNALAEALGRLIADPALRKRMGEAARAFVVERFSERNHLVILGALASLLSRSAADSGV